MSNSRHSKQSITKKNSPETKVTITKKTANLLFQPSAEAQKMQQTLEEKIVTGFQADNESDRELANQVMVEKNYQHRLKEGTKQIQIKNVPIENLFAELYQQGQYYQNKSQTIEANVCYQYSLYYWFLIHRKAIQAEKELYTIKTFPTPPDVLCFPADTKLQLQTHLVTNWIAQALPMIPLFFPEKQLLTLTHCLLEAGTNFMTMNTMELLQQKGTINAEYCMKQAGKFLGFADRLLNNSRDALLDPIKLKIENATRAHKLLSAIHQNNIWEVRQQLILHTEATEQNQLRTTSIVNHLRGLDGHTVLMCAVITQCKEIILLLLNAGADVNAASIFHKETALHLAAGNSDLDTIKILLEHKADIKAQTIYGNNPLTEVICEVVGNSKSNKPGTQYHMFKYLLEQGAELQKTDTEIYAKFIKKCAYFPLLVKQIQQKKKNELSKKLTPILTVETNNQVTEAPVQEHKSKEIIKKDLRKKQHEEYSTVCHVQKNAMLLKDYSQALKASIQLAKKEKKLKKENPNLVLNKFLTESQVRFLQAISLGDVKTAKTLYYENINQISVIINKENSQQFPPLMVAAVTPGKLYLTMTQFLVEECGAYINATDDDGKTVLHHVAMQDELLPVLSYLLSVGKTKSYFNIDVRDEEDRTPLLCAIAAGQIENVKILLAAHANPNLYNIQKEDGFAIAVQLNKSELIQMLDEFRKAKEDESRKQLEEESKSEEKYQNSVDYKIDEKKIETVLRLLKHTFPGTYAYYQIYSRCLEVENVLKKYLAKDNYHINYTLQLGMLYRYMHRHAERELLLDALLLQFPNDDNILIESAYSDLNLGKLTSAKNKFNRVSKLNLLKTQEGLLKIYRKENDKEASYIIASQILSVDKLHVQARLQEMWAKPEEIDDEIAGVRYNELHEQHPADTFVITSYAKYLIRQNEYDSALEFYKLPILQQKKPAVSLLGQAECYELLGETEKSAKLYQTLSSEYALFYHGRLRAAIFYSQQYPDKFSNIERTFQKLLCDFRGQREETYLAFARSCNDIHKDKAISLYDHIIKEFPRTIRPLKDAIHLLLKVGRAEEARIYCEKLLELNKNNCLTPFAIQQTWPNDPEMHLLYIKILRSLRRSAEVEQTVALFQKRFSNKPYYMSQLDHLLSRNKSRTAKPSIIPIRTLEQKWVPRKKPEEKTATSGAFYLSAALPNIVAIYLERLKQDGHASLYVGLGLTKQLLGWNESAIFRYEIITSATPDYLTNTLKAHCCQYLPEKALYQIIDGNTILNIISKPQFKLNELVVDIKPRAFTHLSLYVDQTGLLFDPSGRGITNLTSCTIAHVATEPNAIKQDFIKTPEHMLTALHLAIMFQSRLEDKLLDAIKQAVVSISSEFKNSSQQATQQTFKISQGRLHKLFSEFFIPGQITKYYDLLQQTGLISLCFPSDGTALQSRKSHQWVQAEFNVLDSGFCNFPEWSVLNHTAAIFIAREIYAYYGDSHFDFNRNLTTLCHRYGFNSECKTNEKFIELILDYVMRAKIFISALDTPQNLYAPVQYQPVLFPALATTGAASLSVAAEHKLNLF